MNCKDINKRLLFYLDNELSVKEKQAVELHLSTCPECQKELEALSHTQNLLRQGFHDIAKKAAPPWAWVELEQRLAAVKETKPSHVGRVISGIRSFTSWQPSWKPILSSALVLAVIIISALFVPRLLGTSPEILAIDIAEDSPEVRALAGGEPSVRDTEVSGTTAYVLSQGLSGESNLAYVNLRSSTVVRVFRLTITPLTEEDKSQIVDIAMADPNIRELMDGGAIIDSVYPVTTLFELELIDGKPTVWSKGILAGFTLRAGNQRWIAQINTDEGKVMYVSILPALPFPTRHTEEPEIKYSRENLINIASADTRVRALVDKGAVIVGVATGGRKMADSGSVILKLGEEVWSIKIDLSSQSVTGVEPIPEARYIKAYFFEPER